jgi:hypothetical protein
MKLHSLKEANYINIYKIKVNIINIYFNLNLY